MDKKTMTQVYKLWTQGKRTEVNEILSRHGLEWKPGKTLPTRIGE